MCNFFLYLKEKRFQKTFIKLHEVKSFGREKEQFLSHNSKLKFLDERSSMIKEINSAMLIIHTHCGTGHLESLSINKPTLILFTQDLNLLNAKTKNYYKKFIKIGIVHKTPKSLFKILEKLNEEKKLKMVEYKKRQDLIKKYTLDFGFHNKNKIKNLKQILSKMQRSA